MQAYDTDDRNSANTIGSENLAKLGNTISEMMDFVGLSDARLMMKLEEGTNATKVELAKHEGKIKDREEFVDYPTRKTYVELGLKLKGRLRDIIKHEGSIPAYTGEKSPEDYIEAAISKDKG